MNLKSLIFWGFFGILELFSIAVGSRAVMQEFATGRTSKTASAIVGGTIVAFLLPSFAWKVRKKVKEGPECW